MINTAYQTLSNANKRAMYDLKLQYQRERRRMMQQQQAYYNPRYRQTRPPASVSERYYQNIPANRNRFSRKDLYITLALIGGILLFSLLLKLVMDHITGEDKYKTALTYIEQGKYSNAHSLLSDAVHFMPKRPEVYLARAGLEMNVYENFKAALRDINQAMALQDTVPAYAYYMRGKCYKQLSQYKVAERDLTHAITTDSTIYAAYLDRGEVRLFYLGKTEAAIADLTKFLKHSQRGEAWATALTYRGFGYYMKGTFSLSEADYKRVLAADSTNGRVFYLLGRTEKEQEQQQQACRHFSEAYKLGYSAALLELRNYCR